MARKARPAPSSWRCGSPRALRAPATAECGDGCCCCCCCCCCCAVRWRAQVHPDWAPLGAARMKELVDQDFFSGVRFFRVIQNFMAQFGISGWQPLRASQASGAPARRRMLRSGCVCCACLCPHPALARECARRPQGGWRVAQQKADRRPRQGEQQEGLCHTMPVSPAPAHGHAHARDELCTLSRTLQALRLLSSFLRIRTLTRTRHAELCLIRHLGQEQPHHADVHQLPG